MPVSWMLFPVPVLFFINFAQTHYFLFFQIELALPGLKKGEKNLQNTRNVIK